MLTPYSPKSQAEACRRGRAPGGGEVAASRTMGFAVPSRRQAMACLAFGILGGLWSDPALSQGYAVIDGNSHGIKANGHVADDDALDRAIAASVEAVKRLQNTLTINQYFRGGVTLMLPSGPILLLRGHTIRCAHITVRGQGAGKTVLLKGGGDFGDLFEIIDPKESNNTGDSGFIGLSAIDLGPTSGGALLRLTNCERGGSSDLATSNGFYGLQLDGVVDYVVSNVRCTGDRYFGQTPAQVGRGEQGSSKLGSALIAITQTGSVTNSNVELSNITATGESPTARLHGAAIRVESADVLLIRGAELGAIADADLHVEVSGSKSVQSLQTSEIEFDNGSDYGLKLDGRTSGAVGDWIIEGRFFGQTKSHVSLKCAQLAGASFKLVGLGAGGSPIIVEGGSDLLFSDTILRGFGTSATAPWQVSGFDVRTSGVSVSGGIIKPYSKYDLAYAVRLADGVSGCLVANTISSPGPHAYGGVRCRDRVANRIANNLVTGGAPEVGTA